MGSPALVRVPGLVSLVFRRKSRGVQLWLLQPTLHAAPQPRSVGRSDELGPASESKPIQPQKVVLRSIPVRQSTDEPAGSQVQQPGLWLLVLTHFRRCSASVAAVR